MVDITVSCVMTVLKKALEIDRDFHVSNARANKKYDTKLELIKCGFAYAMKELENQPQLKALYDHQVLHSASSSTGVMKSDSDTRIKYGDMLLFLLANLTKAIETEKASNERSDICELSLGHHNFVNQALTHLKNVAVLPYIPEGIDGTKVDRWWACSEWRKILEDKNYQATQLRMYLTTVLDLMEVSFQVKGTVIAKELLTVIMAAEVLNHLGFNCVQSRYRSFLSGIDAALVFDAASVLIRNNAVETDTRWLNMSMIDLVNETVGKGHLEDLLRTYHKRGLLSIGEDNATSLPFLNDVVKGLCSGKPSSMSQQEYFGSVVDQFFVCLRKNTVARGVCVCLFNLFIDALHKQRPQLTKTLILDRIFIPLEQLDNDDSVEDHFPLALHSLSNLFRLSKIRSRTVTHNIRLRKLCFVLCAMVFEVETAMDQVEEDSDARHELDSFRDDLLICLSVSNSYIHHKEMIILWATRESGILRQIEVKIKQKFITPKIQVMDESENSVWRSPYGRFYPVAYKPTTLDETSQCLRILVVTIINLQREEKKADFIYSALLEVFNAFINEDGYYNRLSGLKNADELRLEYIVHLDVVATKLNEAMIANLDMNPDLFTSSLKTDSTLEKLLNLAKIAMTSVVKNVQIDVSRQKEKASLDVIVPMERAEEQCRMELRGLILSTAKYGIKLTTFIPLLKLMAAEKMAGLESEVNEVVRLTAVLRKLLGEIKQLPEEYRSLKEVFEKDHDVNSAIADLEGSVLTNEENDASFFNKEELVNLLCGMVHEKGQALITIGRLLMKRNTRIIHIYDSTFHEMVLGMISDTDSYVYLAAINCAAEAALAMTDKIIPFVKMFSQVASVKEKKNAKGEVVNRESIEEICVVRCRIAAVICKVFDNLGTAAAVYAGQAIDCVMECIDDETAVVRASVYAVVEHLLRTVAVSYSIHAHFESVLESIKHTLMVEKESQVRRSAIQILPMILRGAGKEMLTRLSEDLVSINRLLNHILHNEQDQVVILHAQLAKEEIKESLNEKLREEMMERTRVITL